MAASLVCRIGLLVLWLTMLGQVSGAAAPTKPADLAEEEVGESAVDEQRQEKRERAQRMPLPSDGYDWREVARNSKLSAAEIDLLAQQKLLIADGRKLRQSFELYEEHWLPVFITSDVLLNAYHGLLEESIQGLERRRIPALRAELQNRMAAARALVEEQPTHASELKAGLLQAQIGVGPAMVLLGTPLDAFDPAVRSEIAAEVAKIRAAAVVELPAWLGPPTADFVAIDYRRMKPVSFYTQPPLDDYFRAVRWLQSVPYRIERDVELTAIAMLANGTDDELGAKKFYQSYGWFLGRMGAHSIIEADRVAAYADPKEPWGKRLAKARTRIRPAVDRVHDGVRTSARPDAEPFRVLPAYVLADAEFFQKLAEEGEPVSGLALAGLLGSKWADAQFKPRKPESYAVIVSAARKTLELDEPYGFDRAALYEQYLVTLAGLFAAPDAAAPAFMRSEAWAAKSCQTSLAGWAQMRHTTVLQARETAVVFGLTIQPPGVIEPNPEFLRRFSELVRLTRAGLADAGALAETPADKAAELRQFVAVVRRLEQALARGEKVAKLPEYEKLKHWAFSATMSGNLPREEYAKRCSGQLWSALADEDLKSLPERLKAFAELLGRTAADYESGREPLPSNMAAYQSPAARWDDLLQTSLRLEALLQKQLRGAPWNKAEGQFIENFGGTMATVMGFFGDANFEDDAARCVAVLDDPRANRSLHVGIGRPRILYVLYPWQGMEVLCAGTVMPYYEFDSRERLTDDEWRARLDSPSAPPPPAWLAPLRVGEAK